MCRCWEELPNLRPKFAALKIEINAVLEGLQNNNPAYLTVEYERPTPKISTTDDTTKTSTQIDSESKLIDDGSTAV